MSDGLREAAARALRSMADEGAPGEVTRVTVDVAVGGTSELVTLWLRDGALAFSSTAEAGGPHVRAALEWLVGVDAPAPTMRFAGDATEINRVSWVPPEEGDAPETPTARARLADALDDVVTVLVRAGADAADSPSVSESLERLRREAPLPTPMGLSRWLGRLHRALDAKDVALLARLLDGAAQLGADLRKERPTPAVRRRVAAWLGAAGDPGAVERISDRTLLEVAREHLPSSERGGIERRYLADVASGEVYREERSKSVPVASVGPCPRVVDVGLAEVEHGTAPRSIRLMQYTVSVELPRAPLRRLAETAYRHFGALADRYRELVREHPGQAEPFAVIAPREIRFDPAPVCFDDAGDPLGLSRVDDPASIEVLARVVPPGGPRWLAGRMVDVDGALLMVPCTVAVPDGDDTRVHRLR